jgi:hypothetical protein
MMRRFEEHGESESQGQGESVRAKGQEKRPARPPEEGEAEQGARDEG